MYEFRLNEKQTVTFAYWKKQQQRLRFQEKKIKDQAETIAEQQKRIEEWIKQQQDPRHNQE